MARIALAWVLQRPFVMSVIIGAKTVEQLDDNLAATEVMLDPAELEVLDRVARCRPNTRLDDRATDRRARELRASQAQR